MHCNFTNVIYLFNPLGFHILITLSSITTSFTEQGPIFCDDVLVVQEVQIRLSPALFTLILINSIVYFLADSFGNASKPPLGFLLTTLAFKLLKNVCLKHLLNI